MPNPLPPSSTLRALEAVARLGSFTAAARELNLTQTAISHQIRILEERLACRVLLISSRAVALTEEGEIYLAAVRPSLKALEEAGRTVRSRNAGLPARIQAAAAGAGDAFASRAEASQRYWPRRPSAGLGRELRWSRNEAARRPRERRAREEAAVSSQRNSSHVNAAAPR